MCLQVLGCSHQQAPLAVREQFSLGPQQLGAALSHLRAQLPQIEWVVLSTCNRFEVYAAHSPATTLPVPLLLDTLALDRSATPSDLDACLFRLDGRGAVQHLFEVASSLDSIVVGETQISAQVKQAYQLAIEQGTAGPMTHAAFQRAAEVAHRVTRETAIHQRRLSVPSVAIAEIARQFFERFDDKNVLVIGAGEMARETLKYVRELGATRIRVVNRTWESATSLARQFRGQSLPWSQLSVALTEADLVISTTGAAHPIVTDADFTAIHANRRGRPLLVLDLAVPRDFALSDERYSDVFLYTVDDLRQVCRRNAAERTRELPRALAIIDAETDRFLAEDRFRSAKPVVTQLTQAFSSVKEGELQRLLKKLSHLDANMQQEISRSFDRLTNKLMHRPLASLRALSHDGAPAGLLESVTQLFRFKNS